MDTNLLKELKKTIKGDVLTDEETLASYSHDASLFEIKPQVVVFPKDEEDVKALVKFVAQNKKNNPSLSLTARSAGTDMTGGPLNESIIVVFEKYFNHIKYISGNIATVEPGVFYRDFEKETLKHNLIFPSYPASREICAMGGIINNDSGGEESLEYGKTERYVKNLRVVLADGGSYKLKPLNETQLKEKLALNTFEGTIYKNMHNLITKNYEILKKAKPNVSKNSAGYRLWDVWDTKNKIFDLTKLFVGAQGTLGLVTEGQIKLVHTRKYAQMMIIFLKNLDHLGSIINEALALRPDSFEAYDDSTLKLAIKFFSSFAKMMGTKNIITTAWNFLPEFLILATFGLPKLVLQVEFTGNNNQELTSKIDQLQKKLKTFHLKTRIAASREAAKKYWLIRRESFNLLRNKIKDKHTAPFIDDLVVQPKYLNEFFPKLELILKKYPSLIYTIAGHVGDGNFHIIPLMDITDPKQREIIPSLSKEVYDLVLKYKGSTSGEHNDGLIRTPFLLQMYGGVVSNLFKQTKQIFDPNNIFNPGKKVGGDLDFAMKHIRQNW